MTLPLLIFWVVCAFFIVFARRAYRCVIFFTVFSLVSSVIYLFLGAPDVAMAEAGISAFATVFFIVCLEKYYTRGIGLEREFKRKKLPISQRFKWKKIIPAAAFSIGLLVLVLMHLPTGDAFLVLRDQYLRMFQADVGGQNAVTAIYLGYRVYDTLFEALLLVIAVVAVFHLSWFEQKQVKEGRHSEIEGSKMTRFTMRIICPILLVFGVYLVLNGHISAGGGFLGGLAFALFLVCRFLVRGIFDMPLGKAVMMEEISFILIVIVPIFAVFTGVLYTVTDITPLMQDLYLIAMNALVGVKVACGFFVLFYRYVSAERLPVDDTAKEGAKQ